MLINYLTGERFSWKRTFDIGTEKSGFEFMLREARLVDDRLKRIDSNFVVIRNGNGDRALSRFFLHDDVASAPANFKKTIFR